MRRRIWVSSRRSPNAGISAFANGVPQRLCVVTIERNIVDQARRAQHSIAAAVCKFLLLPKALNLFINYVASHNRHQNASAQDIGRTFVREDKRIDVHDRQVCPAPGFDNAGVILTKTRVGRPARIAAKQQLIAASNGEMDVPAARLSAHPLTKSRRLIVVLRLTLPAP